MASTGSSLGRAVATRKVVETARIISSGTVKKTAMAEPAPAISAALTRRVWASGATTTADASHRPAMAAPCKAVRRIA